MPNPKTIILDEEAMDSPTLSKTLSGESGFGLDEWHARVELAACFRLMAKFKMTDLTATHACVTIPGSEHILINSFGLRYDEISASNLVEISSNGEVINSDSPINDTGFIIHGAIHNARQDINCVMHTHSRAGLAISGLKEGLIPLF